MILKVGLFAPLVDGSILCCVYWSVIINPKDDGFGLSWFLKSQKILDSQIDSLAAKHIAIYSAHDNNDVHDCFFDLQLAVPLPPRKHTDWLIFKCFYILPNQNLSTPRFQLKAIHHTVHRDFWLRWDSTERAWLPSNDIQCVIRNAETFSWLRKLSRISIRPFTT